MRWLGRFFHRRRQDAQLDSELCFHVEQQTTDNIAAGMDADEARRQALAQFGGLEFVKEECREARGTQFIESLLQDIRYGLRMLRKSPGFTTVAILTLALGSGATTAIFSLVDSTLLHPLPYPHPEQLVSLVDDLPGLGAHNVGLNEPEWQDLQRSGIFQYVSPTWYDENDLTGASRPARVHLYVVAPDYFALLGVKPQLGRAFNPEDHSPGLLPEVLISDASWKRDFGSDPHVLGKSVRLDTDRYQCAGHFASNGRCVVRPSANRPQDVRGRRSPSRHCCRVGMLHSGAARNARRPHGCTEV